jgi:hypothetical protein
MLETAIAKRGWTFDAAMAIDQPTTPLPKIMLTPKITPKIFMVMGAKRGMRVFVTGSWISTKLVNRDINHPITCTGCNQSKGSPIKRSRLAAKTKISKFTFIPFRCKSKNGFKAIIISSRIEVAQFKVQLLLK